MPETIISIINRKKSKDLKTMVLPSKKRRLLGRRRHSFVNFYDFGMVSTGTGFNDYTDLDYGPIVPAFASSYDHPISGGNSEYTDLAGSDYDGLIAKILETPVEEWRSHFKRLVPDSEIGLNAVLYEGDGTTQLEGLELNTDGAPQGDFSTSGWKAPSSYFAADTVMRFTWIRAGARAAGDVNNPQIYSQSFYLNDNDTTPIKVTNLPDIDAPEVPFTPSRGMDIFMLPTINFTGAWALIDDPGVTPLEAQHLNEFWMTWPRKSIHDVAHPLYSLPASYAGSYFTGSRLPPNGFSPIVYNPTIYAQSQALAAWMKTLTNARGQYSTDNVTFPVSDDGTYFLTHIPTTPDIPPLLFYVTYVKPANTNSRLLYAVVLKGNTPYYLWDAP